MAFYSLKCETELHCDASSLGFCSVLLQRQNDGKFHSIAFYSKSTSDAESKYHSFEVQILSIIYALRRFRTYLEGIAFKIVTDYNSLALTLNKINIIIQLDKYNYSIDVVAQMVIEIRLMERIH